MGELSARQVRRVLPVAVVLTWFGPFSVDAYSPAFPNILAEFGTSEGLVQLTLSATLVGMAGGQLVAGPLSDRYGRRRPLLVGLAGYVVASVLCAFAWSVEVLVAARLFQGLTAATGIVMARAIGRDVHSGPALARFYSLIAAATALAPLVAPVVGAGMLQAGMSWRWIFGLTLLLGLVGLLLTTLVLPETHPTFVGGHRSTAAVPAPPSRLLRRPHVLAAAGVLGFCGAAMLANLAGLSFYLQDERGLGPVGYAVSFGAGALALIVGSNVNRLLQRRCAAQGLLTVSVPVMLLFTVLLAVAQGVTAPLAIVIALVCLFMGCWGFVLPNALAFGMTVERTAAGRASAILGTAQFGVAAFATPLVGVVPTIAGVPAMATVMTTCVALAVAVHVALLRSARRSAAARDALTPPLPTPASLASEGQ